MTLVRFLGASLYFFNMSRASKNGRGPSQLEEVAGSWREGGGAAADEPVPAPARGRDFSYYSHGGKQLLQNTAVPSAVLFNLQ